MATASGTPAAVAVMASSSLMNVVAEEERKFSEYGCNVNEYAYNTSIQELDGKVNVIEDYTEDFVFFT